MCRLGGVGLFLLRPADDPSAPPAANRLRSHYARMEALSDPDPLFRRPGSARHSADRAGQDASRDWDRFKAPAQA